MKILGIDIDGVLADFNAGYRKKFINYTGLDLFRGEVDPPCWNYEASYGYTPEQTKAVWSLIRDDDYFWRGLSPYAETRTFLRTLDNLPEGEVYFITSRVGIDVKGQTERWLQDHGFTFNIPTVLIARGEKGPLAKSLGITHFIDDRPENCHSVELHSPETQVRLLRRRYNEHAQTVLRTASNLQDFLNLITTEVEA